MVRLTLLRSVDSVAALVTAPVETVFDLTHAGCGHLDRCRACWPHAQVYTVQAVGSAPRVTRIVGPPFADSPNWGAAPLPRHGVLAEIARRRAAASPPAAAQASAMTLDDYAQLEGIAPISLLLLSATLGAVEALLGASHLLASGRIHAVALLAPGAGGLAEGALDLLSGVLGKFDVAWVVLDGVPVSLAVRQCVAAGRKRTLAELATALADQYDLTMPNVLTLDLPGGELAVLGGATKLLEHVDVVSLSMAGTQGQAGDRDAVDTHLSRLGFFEAPPRCSRDGTPQALLYVRKERLWKADPLAMIRRVMQGANVALCRVGWHGGAAQAALRGARSLAERIAFCGLQLKELTISEQAAGAALGAGLEDLDVLVSSDGGLAGFVALLEAALDSSRLCAIVLWGSLSATEVESATRVAFDHGFLLDRESASATARAFLRSSVIRDPAGWLATNNTFGRREFRFSALGQVGRFGNQLFQIMHLLLSSLRHNARASTCTWAPNAYFRLGFLEAAGQGRRWEVAPGMWQIMAVWALEELPDDIDYQAHLQWIAPFLSRHAAFINRCFDLNPKWVAPARQMIEMLRAGCTTLTAFHVRRTDYLSAERENPWHQQIPMAWYRRALETRGESRIFAASDDLDYVEQGLPGLTLTTHRQFDGCGLPPLLIDHCVMRAADTLLMVNSTFSRSAGLLAAGTQTVLLPSLRERAFAPYSPWHDPVFWSRFEDRHFADPQQHADAVERWLAAVGVPQLLAHEKRSMPLD